MQYSLFNMDRRLLLLVCTLLMSSFMVTADSVKRLSEPIEIDQFSETFGARFVVKGDILGLKSAVAESDCEQDKSVTIKTKVSEVCQAKGCFLIATEGDFHTRVTFQDYGFFVPTNISGKEVVMNAVLTPRELSVNELQHIKDDLGTETSIVEGPICELTAQSVKVLN